jgi:hypothetical protein
MGSALALAKSKPRFERTLLPFGVMRRAAPTSPAKEDFSKI